jgi:HAE1 family hydrophobic/amphiphilic exporter-1
MALILSIGFVVDDAIVMLENIVRHMEMGESPWEASLNGSREIGFTIVSMTLSLATVFIPIVFMGGILGRLLKEFGMTIGAAILISGVVSVTLTPMLCSRFLRPFSEKKHGALYNAIERMFNGMHRGYEWSLQRVLRHRLATMAVSVLILAATVYLFLKIPKGFVPPEDRGVVMIVTEAPQGTSFPQMVRYQEELAELVRHDGNVDVIASNISGGGSGMTLGGTNMARLMVNLKPRAERPLSADQVIERWRPRLSGFAGMRTYLQNPPALKVGGALTKSAYQYTLQAPDTEELYREAEKFEPIMARLPALQDVGSDLQIHTPQVNVVINRDKAAALNVNAQQIENGLYDAYGSRWVSTIYAANNQYKVLLELEPQYQADPNALALLYVKSTDGRLVPLNTVAKMVRNAGPQTINHLGQLPGVTLSFNLRPGVALGDAVSQIQEAARQNLPPTISTTFQGTAKAFESSLGNLWVLLIVAIVVVYIVLGILYESYIHPLTILSGLPSAGFGALLTLLLFHIDLNIYAFVGLIMLIGIVKKNAIMQIDFALVAERKEGKPPLEAIYEGCLIRFRPIMMTTMAALLGALPIALGWGAGGEARKPLGLTVVGGLLFSQLITLYLTPVFYTYMAALQERLGRRNQKVLIEPAAS